MRSPGFLTAPDSIEDNALPFSDIERSETPRSEGSIPRSSTGAIPLPTEANRMNEATVTREKILDTIYATIDETNHTLPAEDQLAREPTTPLFGPAAKLDSLGLVSLIVNLEQNLATTFGVGVTLADEKAMSQRTSPFRTVGTLAEYVEQLIRNHRG